MSKKIKLAFFDLDCTLSEPIYKKDDGSFVVGFPQDEWIQYCKDHPITAYEYCKPIPLVETYAANLKNKDKAELLIISAIADTAEINPKLYFIHDHYKYLFDRDHILFADDKNSKIDIIKRIAGIRSVSLDECELIEDDFNMVLAATANGIKGTTTAKIFNDRFFNSPLRNPVYVY